VAGWPAGPKSAQRGRWYRVGLRRALPDEPHRGRAWEPFQGSHQDVPRGASPVDRQRRAAACPNGRPQLGTPPSSLIRSTAKAPDASRPRWPATCASGPQ
jgi:hypothetical protein